MKLFFGIVLSVCFLVSMFGCVAKQNHAVQQEVVVSAPKQVKVELDPIEKELKYLESLDVSSTWGSSPADDRGLWLKDEQVKRCLSGIADAQKRSGALREKIAASTSSVERKAALLNRLAEVDGSLSQNKRTIEYLYLRKR